jgi:homoserine dehydrogenase
MTMTKVAIVGLGTVGTGVARLLDGHGTRPARHAGRRMVLVKALKNAGKLWRIGSFVT